MMRLADLALIIATAGALVMAIEDRSRVDIRAEPTVETETSTLITCPLRKPEFATVMQAAFVGDGTLLVEQQTRTRVRHIKDC